MFRFGTSGPGRCLLGEAGLEVVVPQRQADGQPVHRPAVLDEQAEIVVLLLIVVYGVACR